MSRCPRGASAGTYASREQNSACKGERVCSATTLDQHCEIRLEVTTSTWRASGPLLATSLGGQQVLVM